MTALPIAPPLSPIVKLLAILPVFLATILWPGPRAAVREHSFCKEPVTAASCHAFEPKVYLFGFRGDPHETWEIEKVEEEADCWLDWSDLPACERKLVTDSWAKRASSGRSSNLAPYFLKRGKQNGLFVVRVSPVFAREHPVDSIDALKKYAFDRGYKRVLILGEHCVGVTVVYDSAFERLHVRPIGR
jgi:hypothetical protein